MEKDRLAKHPETTQKIQLTTQSRSRDEDWIIFHKIVRQSILLHDCKEH